MKKWLTLFIAVALGLLTACAPTSDVPSDTMEETYDTEIELTWESTRNSLSATDAYGRHFGAIDAYDKQKQVGLFYFLWLGSDEKRSVYDSSLLSEDTLKNDKSSVGAFHYWTEPLYGYYDSGDPWVIRRHMELFALAGVDYIVFDTSNGYIYEEVCENLLSVALDLQKQGWEVPKLIFYCHNRTKNTATEIYDRFYDPDTENGKRYASLWYTDGDWNDRNAKNKPWILVKNNGTGSGDQGAEQNFDMCRKEIREFFYTRELRWSGEGGGGDYLFPSDIDNPIVHEGMISVSTAQHTSGAFSDSLFEAGGKDVNRGRGWSDSDKTNSESRAVSGSNFEEEFEYAFSFGDDVDNLFITSWNEWVAQKQPFGANSRSSCYFVDQFNPEFSRDIEMTKGLWGDAYYLQLMRNIRTFKAKGKGDTSSSLSKTIRMGGSLRQWEGTTGYLDMQGDTTDRDFHSANYTAGGNVPSVVYTNTTGRNDIVRTRVTYDEDHVYFLVECAENISIPSAGDRGWMNIFIEVEGLSGSAWNNYQFVVNRNVTGAGSTLERLSANGTSQKVADVQYSMSGNALMVRVPREELGISDGEFTLYFKVADNVTNYTDIMDYYVNGDSAPLGRLNFTFHS